MQQDDDRPDHDHEIEQDLKALEHRITAWRPTAGALDRDRMLYESGRAAARSDASIRVLRLSMAALLLLSIGLGGLLAQQTSLLERERSLLALERSQRRGLEDALAERARSSELLFPAPSMTESPRTEPLSPSSYLALTARLADDITVPSWPEIHDQAEPHPTSPAPLDPRPRPAPLRPGDLRRVLDL